MTDHQKHNWKSYCFEPLELVENYMAAKADDFEGWCIHHRLEIKADGTRVSAQELIDQNLYYGRPASELVFMRKLEHHRLHWIGNTNTKGKQFSAEHRKKIAEARKGKHHSAETRHKLSEAKKDSHWWNDGVSCKRSKECPGEGWKRGRLKASMASL